MAELVKIVDEGLGHKSIVFSQAKAAAAGQRYGAQGRACGLWYRVLDLELRA